MRVYLIGNSSDYALESSYRRAFQKMGMKVTYFDPFLKLRPYIPFSRIGEFFNRFVPVDSWQRKMNRELALDIKHHNPDLILVFCNTPILFSTLAFIKSVAKGKFILVWPDPLTNLQSHVREAASLYDGVATYCYASVAIFKQLGFHNVQWVPLAADPELHLLKTVPTSFAFDLTFLGAWRPEREKTLAAIVQHFSRLRIAVRGTDWQRNKTSSLRPYITNKALRGYNYANFLNSSRINLNVIDETCFPAANMRFFEIPVTCGLQLASRCPEMENDFLDKKHILYYANNDDLLSTIERIFISSFNEDEIRHSGLEHTLNNHTYSHRAEQLVKMVLEVPEERNVQC